MSSEGQKIEPRRLKGFRDFLPDLMEARSRLQELIRRHARIAGFREIGTPALEYAETLLGQGGDETDKQVYRFEDHGGRTVALRFDLTVPFARFVAEHQGDMIFPFKRLQIGEVWRGENTQKGRYREFCQCDLDIIGVDSVNADLEVISVFYRIIRSLNCGPFTMRIGHRRILSALISRALPGCTSEIEARVLIALDKLDKIGRSGVEKILKEIPFVGLADISGLLDCILTRDNNGHSDGKLIRSYLGANSEALVDLARIDEIIDCMQKISTKRAGGQVLVDLSIARGLGYYTGIVFETTLDQIPGFGSISSGGRYNNLAERFTNKSLPGVGGSIGLDRLLAGLEETKKIVSTRENAVFIAIATPDALSIGAQLVDDLRDVGVSCEIGLTTGKVGNQFKYADRIGCPFVCTLGTDELTSGLCSIKSMRSGHETKAVKISDVAAMLSQMLQAEK